MEQQEQIEQLVLTCIDTARAMLKEYELVVPFGIRGFSDSEDLKMNCPSELDENSDWNEQIIKVVNELKQFLKDENVSICALVTSLQSGDELAIGLQIETELSSALFIYPYRKENEEWVIDEPVKTDQLLPSVYADNAD